MRAHLVPAFGAKAIEKITAEQIEYWRDALVDERGLSRRSVNRLLMGSILERAKKTHGLLNNPVREVPKLRVRWDPNAYDFHFPDEIQALGAAAASDQDRAVFLTAAFTGLRRGELVPSLFFIGAGVGASIGQLFRFILTSVSMDEVGSASGVLEAVQQLSSALGVAVLGTIFFSAFDHHLPPYALQITAWPASHHWHPPSSSCSGSPCTHEKNKLPRTRRSRGPETENAWRGRSRSRRSG